MYKYLKYSSFYNILIGGNLLEEKKSEFKKLYEKLNTPDNITKIFSLIKGNEKLIRNFDAISDFNTLIERNIVPKEEQFNLVIKLINELLDILGEDIIDKLTKNPPPPPPPPPAGAVIVPT